MSKSFWEGTVYRSINWRGNVLGGKCFGEETSAGGNGLGGETSVFLINEHISILRTYNVKYVRAYMNSTEL